MELKNIEDALKLVHQSARAKAEYTPLHAAGIALLSVPLNIISHATGENAEYDETDIFAETRKIFAKEIEALRFFMDNQLKIGPTQAYEKTKGLLGV